MKIHLTKHQLWTIQHNRQGRVDCVKWLKFLCLRAGVKALRETFGETAIRTYYRCKALGKVV